jgi:hypothetical protein
LNHARIISFAAILLISSSLLLSGCGGGYIDTPKRFYEMLRLYSARKDYDNLFALHTKRAHAEFERDRFHMNDDLYSQGFATENWQKSDIGDWYRGPNGEKIDTLKKFGCNTYLELVRPHLDNVFAKWCQNRGGWNETIELTGASELVSCSVIGQDSASLKIRYNNGATDILQLYRHKGRWYITENWLLRERIQ